MLLVRTHAMEVATEQRGAPNISFLNGFSGDNNSSSTSLLSFTVGRLHVLCKCAMGFHCHIFSSVKTRPSYLNLYIFVWFWHSQFITRIDGSFNFLTNIRSLLFNYFFFYSIYFYRSYCWFISLSAIDFVSSAYVLLLSLLTDNKS